VQIFPTLISIPYETTGHRPVELRFKYKLANKLDWMFLAVLEEEGLNGNPWDDSRGR
jgi:hypothetical protein